VALIFLDKIAVFFGLNNTGRADVIRLAPMPSMNEPPVKPNDLAWLADVQETRRPLTEVQPIWVRRSTITRGPSVPQPEYHPYCEINIILDGTVQQCAGRYQFLRQAGDVFLAGPSLPHYGLITHPTTTLIVYFLPSVLLRYDAEIDASRILYRFTNQNSQADIHLRPPAALVERLTQQFQTMLAEFERPQFGSKLKLQDLLISNLVELMRWEQSQGKTIAPVTASVTWGPVERALRFLRTHYTERIYAQEVAHAARVSPTQLRRLFQKTLNTSWVHYLQNYRIHRAAALLLEPTRSVTEIAFAVGFEDLGHFITVFRKRMGVAPSRYIKTLTPSTPPPTP